MSARILILDIETSPLVVHVWRLWKNDVGLNQVVKDWNIIAFAAKWYGEDKVFYADLRNKDIHDDRPLLKKLWLLMDEADIIITQNGQSFDIKKINARFVINDFPPPSQYRQIDTKVSSQKKFGFTSYRLAYMTDKTNRKFKKLTHKKYPGHDLWKECLNGNLDAWKEMEVYNTYDVLSTEEYYKRTARWYNTINFGVYSDSDEKACHCGSKKFKKRGFMYTQNGKFQRYECVKCGAATRDRENLLTRTKKQQPVPVGA